MKYPEVLFLVRILNKDKILNLAPLSGCSLIEGKVVEDFGFPSVELLKFAKLPIVDNPIMVLMKLSF